MDDRYDGYAGDSPYELVGYDEYGQPMYRQVPPGQEQAQGGYDPYATGTSYGAGGYSYDDPYGTGQQPAVPPQDPYGTGQQPAVPPHDPYGTGQQPAVPSYDPYGTGQQPAVPPQDPYGTGQQAAVPPYDPYASGHFGEAGGYDPYGSGTGTGEQPRYDEAARAARSRTAEQTAYIPQQPGPQGPGAPAAPDGRGPRPAAGHGEHDDGGPGTDQFAFVEEPDEDSEDVIDWLAFTESRTERREEARRRSRNRIVALVVVLALAVVGGVGYLWQAGKLPGLSSDDKRGGATATGPQNRDVIVVHLHNTKQGGTSTALLVDNTTTRRGSTVLLPNSLSLTGDDGTATTLGKSVDDDGSTGTREAIDTLLGTQIQGTWRLDTPYLENLVDLIGNIDIDTDADVPDPGAKTDAGKKDSGDPKAKSSSSPTGSGSILVHKGEDQTLSGAMAVAYATYRAPGEQETAQLTRFGQVMQGVLRKMSSDPGAATVTVQTLAQILDPSLSDKDLGAFLAKLADQAKGGDYRTTLLPVQQDGTLSEQAIDGVVKNELGGTVKAPDKNAAARVGVKNATGEKAAASAARVALINGGYTFVEGGTDSATRAASQVVYADAARKGDATEVAKTLGLPTSAVRKGTVTANADISVVLGTDYDYKAASDTP